MSKEAYTEALRAALQFKRFALARLPVAHVTLQGDGRPASVPKTDQAQQVGIAVRDQFSIGLTYATTVVIGSDALKFWDDGVAAFLAGEARLPISPLLLVPVQSGGTVADLVLYLEDEERIYFITPVWKDDGFKRCRLLGAVFYFEKQGGAALAAMSEEGKPSKELTDDCVDRGAAPLYCLLGALRAGAATMRRPSVQLAVTKLQARKAGAATVDYRVCCIDPAITPRSAQRLGGTHASPKWHLRRGHYRHLADGRVVFVRQAEVGDPARGAVVKDYTLEMAA